MGVGVFPPDAGSGGQGGKYLELPPIIDQEVRRVRAREKMRDRKMEIERETEREREEVRIKEIGNITN